MRRGTINVDDCPNEIGKEASMVEVTLPIHIYNQGTLIFGCFLRCKTQISRKILNFNCQREM